jgi:thiamine biosynthesis protein ThiS
MKITLNGEPRSLTTKISLKQLVSELGLDNKRLAIEVNQEIVPRSEYDTHLLQEADQVEIVQAIGGG